MAFPDEKTLKRMRAKLDKVEGTLMISSNATPLQKLRWDLCQKFVRYTREHDLTQDQLAKVLRVDKAKVSKILHHRIDEFSTDRLITLYQQLTPDIKFRVG